MSDFLAWWWNRQIDNDRCEMAWRMAMRERDEARAEVERLRGELERTVEELVDTWRDRGAEGV